MNIVDNTIQHLYKNIFMGLNNLIGFDSSSNQITLIATDAFVTLSNLLILVLNHKKIKHLYKDTFKSLASLRELDSQAML